MFTKLSGNQAGAQKLTVTITFEACVLSGTPRPHFLALQGCLVATVEAMPSVSAPTSHRYRNTGTAVAPLTVVLSTFTEATSRCPHVAPLCAQTARASVGRCISWAGSGYVSRTRFSSSLLLGDFL